MIQILKYTCWNPLEYRVRLTESAFEPRKKAVYSLIVNKKIAKTYIYLLLAFLHIYIGKRYNGYIFSKAPGRNPNFRKTGSGSKLFQAPLSVKNKNKLSIGARQLTGDWRQKNWLTGKQTNTKTRREREMKEENFMYKVPD